MGIIKAVCISEKKGTPKKPVAAGELVEGFGLRGDAHGGSWHRQVSLLSYEKAEDFRNAGAPVADGSFGENLLVSGMDLKSLPVGTVLKCGNALLQVTQIGKECHSRCVIGQTMGRCIMPEGGIFARVLRGGIVRNGDVVDIDRSQELL